MSASELADRLGLRRYARSWRGCCPACDYAGGAFSVREVRGRTRLFCANGCTYDELQQALARRFGDNCRFAARPNSNRTRSKREQRRASAFKQRLALAIWAGSGPVPGTAAESYLASRRLRSLAGSPALRFRADCVHPEGGKHPALVAAAVNTSGNVIAIHRTFLKADGSGKADAEPHKASLGPVWGGAVRFDPLAAEIVIGEGIETSASAGLMLGLPCWAALSAGNLGRGLALPAEVRRVVIAVDADPAGRDAARAAWFRWRGEGREVRIALPDREGCDFNDLLSTRLPSEVA